MPRVQWSVPQSVFSLRLESLQYLNGFQFQLSLLLMNLSWLLAWPGLQRLRTICIYVYLRHLRSWMQVLCDCGGIAAFLCRKWGSGLAELEFYSTMWKVSFSFNFFFQSTLKQKCKDRKVLTFIDRGKLMPDVFGTESIGLTRHSIPTLTYLLGKTSVTGDLTLCSAVSRIQVF